MTSPCFRAPSRRYFASLEEKERVLLADSIRSLLPSVAELNTPQTAVAVTSVRLLHRRRFARRESEGIQDPASRGNTSGPTVCGCSTPGHAPLNKAPGSQNELKQTL